MPIIDADTHIDETEATWGVSPRLRARVQTDHRVPQPRRPSASTTRYWLIDGHRQSRQALHPRRRQHPDHRRRPASLLDVPARLRDMDAMGTEVQVLYPTLFLMESPNARKCPPRCAAATTAGSPTAAPSPVVACAGSACRR